MERGIWKIRIVDVEKINSSYETNGCLDAHKLSRSRVFLVDRSTSTYKKAKRHSKKNVFTRDLKLAVADESVKGGTQETGAGRFTLLPRFCLGSDSDV